MVRYDSMDTNALKELIEDQQSNPAWDAFDLSEAGQGYIKLSGWGVELVLHEHGWYISDTSG